MTPRLRTQEITITAARVVFNSTDRTVTTLLPGFREGMGVSVARLRNDALGEL